MVVDMEDFVLHLELLKPILLLQQTYSYIYISNSLHLIYNNFFDSKKIVISKIINL